jgi:hypothetical protein
MNEILNVEKPLSEREETILAECEHDISLHLRSFIKVGRALATIRDKRLYRTSHQSFEAYCAARWELSRPHCYRLIDGATTVETIEREMSPMGDKNNTQILPANERQVRPLAGLSVEVQLEVWKLVVDRHLHDGETITGRLVQRCVNEVLGAQVDKIIKQASNKKTPIPPEFSARFKSLLTQLTKTLDEAHLHDLNGAERDELAALLRNLLDVLEAR